jgi:DNA phosphorothioation-dependent restriction protein DptG
MCQLMERAFEKARQLPEHDQESIASIILQEIESEQRWDDLFTRPESADLLSRMADEALSEAKAGRARKINGLVDHP